ncbi:sodium:solute symporter [Aureivirga sp. CE67]|uniref:sodium:solute symporter n=1 Tax=Aureivirga sp. CE67 TaxID=1788983 RepID=UPI0018CB1C06|nr:sodium:solute symporter [Aureivirga sp. CE67]
MHLLDWIVLGAILLLIVGYGIYKTRNINTTESYLKGTQTMPWWAIGLSVMATQASAITFLSTPGQAYDDGMRFAQFYFGLPIAMILLCVFVIPFYYKLNVYTAYEFLEKRFDLKTRTLTAVFFLVQRGLSAGLTIFAPAIILSSIIGWDLNITNLLIGLLVIVYTVSGGTAAVSQTQKQQMFVILTGMFIAFLILVQKLPENVNVGDAVDIAGYMGKMNIVDFEFDLDNKYNIWSALLGGTFLFLAYFGTDQSQVQRYLSGKNLAETKLGLLFNGIFKVPMQVGILFIGIMVFTFFQFHKAPLHFNRSNVESIKNSEYGPQYAELQKEYSKVGDEKRAAIYEVLANEKANQPNEKAIENMNVLENKERDLRENAKTIISEYSEKNDLNLETNDSDYVFITFIMNYLPTGLIGLLLAVIFSAAMSSTASELNALSTTTVIDIYKRSFVKNQSDKHYLRMSKFFTLLWGAMALFFATFISLFANLIEAVNVIGSLFYGTVLGVFVVAFFVKFVRGNAVFLAAIAGEIIVVTLFILDKKEIIDLTYLWLNLIGCAAVVFFGILFQIIRPSKGEPEKELSLES